jgi:phosphohistidine phosphatase SixA
VGHNPAAQQIVCRLSARTDLEFPTSALAVIGLSDWGRLAPGTGMIHSLWTPRTERD